jgi:hypothetical protein
MFTIQPDGLVVPTTYYLLGGNVPPVSPFNPDYHVNNIYPEVPITLLTEPYGCGVEQQLATASAQYPRNGIDVRFVATGATGTGVDGTASGVNVASLVTGLLNQVNKATVSPIAESIAANLAFYFGSVVATFSRIILGIETAKIGGWSGVWEYWNGSAWTSVTTTSSFRTGTENTEFDKIANLGAVRITGSTTGWTTKAITVNGVSITAYYLRYRITSVSTINLIRNPSVETNSTDWSSLNSTVTRDGTGNAFGAWQMKATTTNVTNSGIQYDPGAGNRPVVTAGVPVTVSGYLRLGAAGSKLISLLFRWFTAADAELTTVGSDVTVNSTSYSRFSATATPPVTAARVLIRVATSGAQGVFDFYIDALMLEVGSSASPYIDGDQSGAAWNGTAHASTSSVVMTAPVFTNGPVNSLTGMAIIAAGAIPGDYEAAGMIHLKNPASAALGGVEACLITGENSDQPPPNILGLVGADQYLPSGDTTFTITTDTSANFREHIAINFLQSITERGQQFNGVDQYITVTPGASDKLGALPANTFSIEVLFKASSVPNYPICLASQWTSTNSGGSWWLGIDEGKLKFMVRKTNDVRKTANGTTDVLPGEWVLACGVYDKEEKCIKIKRDGHNESTNRDLTTLNTGLTTPVRFGRSVGFDVDDSISGEDTEGFFHGIISNVRIMATTPDDLYDGHYNWPGIGTDIENDSSNIRYLLRMENNAANTTITDSATTFAAAQSAARSSGNTSANTVAGYFQPGGGQTAKILGFSIPRTWGEEYRSRVKIKLRAVPNGTLSTVDDVIFRLQLSIGDVTLPMGDPFKFPSTEVPGSSGWYLLDAGTFSLPNVALRHTGPGGVLANAKNVLKATLFAQHQFIAATTVKLDCLYLMPTTTWYGEWSSFRDTYNTAYDINQNTGVLFDSLGPETVIGQTGIDGYTNQVLNPYGDSGGSDHVVLVANKPAWLFAIPKRGVTATNDCLVHVLTDSLESRIHAVGLYDMLAVA